MPIRIKQVPIHNLAIPGVSHEELSPSTCTSGGWNYVYLNALRQHFPDVVAVIKPGDFLNRPLHDMFS